MIITTFKKVFNFIDNFEKPNDNRLTINIFSALFLAFILLFTGTYYLKAINRSANKELWVDEDFAYKVNVTQQPILDFVINGAHEEASGAPLDYIFARAMYVVEHDVQSFGLPFRVYRRLHVIMYGLLSAWFLSILILVRIRAQATNSLIFIAQLICIGMALWFYLFFDLNFFFWIEMRAYGLWNTTWLCAMALFMLYGGFSRYVTMFLIAAGATATGSIFQLLCFALSYAIIQFVYRNDFKSILLSLFRYWLPALIVCLYYLFGNVHQYGYEHYEEYMKNFWKFWLSKEFVPILSILGIALSIKNQRLKYGLIVFLTMLLLYLISPIINYIIIRRGVFFSSRHYRYYDLIYSIFLIFISINLPILYQNFKALINRTKGSGLAPK